MPETIHDELLRLSDELDRLELYGAAQAMVRGARRIVELEEALRPFATEDRKLMDETGQSPSRRHPTFDEIAKLTADVYRRRRE